MGLFRSAEMMHETIEPKEMQNLIICNINQKIHYNNSDNTGRSGRKPF